MGFANLPEDIADEIKDAAPSPRRGIGAVRVEVTVDAATWRTSVFPSHEAATVVLPVKQAVLEAEGLTEGDTVVSVVTTV